MSVFLRELEEYDRGIDVIGGYFKQTKRYLSLRSKGQVSDDRISAWLRKEFGPGGRFEMKPPKVKISVRDPETGDRKPGTTNMMTLLKLIRDKQLIVSPSMTIYTPAHVKRSLLSEFIDENIAKRGKVKEEMFAAQAAKNEVLARNKENEQNSLKQRNNGLSGAHSSPFTILFNKSTHSSLTSMCRSATSYGNANNEKLIGGSRHYWAPGMVTNNILATCELTDEVEFQACMDTYKMHYPTVDEVMDVITYSTDLFWRNGWALGQIRELVAELSPLQRAAFVYIGDMYHVTKYNDSLVRTIMSDFVQRADTPLEDYADVKKSLDGDTKVLLSLMYSDYIGASNLKDVERKTPEKYKIIMAGAKKLYDNINKWLPFFRAIMFTRNVPASIAKLPETIRRVSMVSDTDSTMGTTQWWSDWYCGEGAVGREADAVADTMTYFAVQNIAHMLARMSANVGVARNQTFRYSMKNEYKFAAFTLTSKAKHYFSVITSREGTLYEDPELEVKGVALRTSNIPAVIMKEFRGMIKDISMTVMNGGKVKLFPIMKRIAEIEDSIVDSVHNGDFKYLKTGNVKSKEGYTKPESSNYVYYEMWEDVFAPKYGTVGAPPYGVVKLSVDLANKTSVNRWLAKMEDKALADRMRKFLAKKSGGQTFTQFLVPEIVAASNGIPKEMLDIADYRKIIFGSVEPYYHVLESLGVYSIDKNRTRLLSDYYGTRAKNRINTIESEQSASDDAQKEAA